MPTIKNPKLKITPNNSMSASCVVTFSVSYTPQEREQIYQGQGFIMRCELWGSDDHIFDHTDNKVYTFLTKLSNPNFTLPPPPEGILTGDVFWEAVHSFRLNGDDSASWKGQGGRSDEVYAKLILLDTKTHTEISVNTPVVHGYF